jgi:hypothetical protein
VNQAGDITGKDDSNMSGTGDIDVGNAGDAFLPNAGDAFLPGGGAGNITATVAIGTAGRDGIIWKQIN